jgi:hypothetical protein
VNPDAGVQVLARTHQVDLILIEEPAPSSSRASS